MVMNGAPVIEIAEMVLPVSGQHAAEQVTQALHDETARLYHTDQASGLAWSGELQGLAFTLDEMLEPGAMGRAIALQLRNRLVRADRVREVGK
jgi:hypothetical protein